MVLALPVLAALALFQAPLAGPELAQRDARAELAARAGWGRRAVRLQAALAAAEAGGDEDQARAERARARLAPPPRAGTSWHPGPAALTAALRELTGPLPPLSPELAGEGPARPREQAELQELVDGLELIAVPGAFFAPAEGQRGEPVTVAVSCVTPPEGFGELELRLFWLGPRGERERARSEPVTFEALRAGFPMYVRAPHAADRAPGRWWLAPELVRHGPLELALGACSEGAPLACLGPDPEPPRAPEEAVSETGARDLLQSARALERESGLRWSLTLDALDLDQLLAAPEAAAPGRALPVEPAARGAAGSSSAAGASRTTGLARAIWCREPLGLAPGSAPALALVLVAREHEPDDLLLAGVVGERWAALADRRGARLLAVAADSGAVPGAGGGGAGRGVARALELARERGLAEGGRALLVLRGASSLRLAVDPPPGFDAAVIAARVGAPEVLLPDRPRLVLTPGLERAQAEGLELAPARGVDVLDDLALPAEVDGYLERLGW